MKKKNKYLISTSLKNFFSNETIFIIQKYICVFFAILGLIYIFLTPPFQSPDEGNHFLRAFGISDGVILSEKRGELTGSMLPAAVVKESGILYKLPFIVQNKTSRSEILKFYKESPKLDHDVLSERIFKGYSNTALYSPVPYIPQTTGIIISRVLKLKILTSFYICRLMNWSVSVLILFFTLKLFSKISSTITLLFIVLIGTPMFIFQMSSCSPDSFTNSITFLNIALIFSLSKEWDNRKFDIFLISAMMLALSKNVYFLIPFCILPVIFFRKYERMKKARDILYTFSFVIIPVLIWSKLSMANYNPILATSVKNPAEQLLFFLNNPFKLIRAFAHTWHTECINYSKGYIGVLGWLDTEITHSLLYFIIIITAAVFTPDKVKLKFQDFIERFYYMVIFFVSFFFISMSIYLTWCSPGSFNLWGVQGRYFIPIVPVLLLSFTGLVNIGKVKYNAFYIFTLLFIFLFQLHAISNLIIRYYG